MARKSTTKSVKKTTSKPSKSESPKTKESLMFEIDQLKKDKMVYSLESAACTLAALLFLIGISVYLPRQYAIYARNLYNLGFGIAIGYWLITVIGNVRRSSLIRKLEKDLSSAK